MLCPICGKPRNLVASLFAGATHPQCAKAQEQRLRAEAAARQRAEAERQREQYQQLAAQISAGVFKNLNREAEIFVEQGETCLAVIKGCWCTLFYARAAGRVAPGQAIRVDGLKKSDFGALYVTDKRICFVGKGGAKVLPIKKLLMCETYNDVLHLTPAGRASSSYFIMESKEALELTAACIRKLMALARDGKKPIIE